MEKAVFSKRYFVDCPMAESEKGYHRFLDFVFQYADGFTLSYQKLGIENKGPELDEFQNSRWGYLAKSVCDCECTTESPVTIGPQVLLLYFRFDDATREFLRERTNIYDFKGHDWQTLWDPAFLKEGKIFFISCTHERFCSIDEDFLDNFDKQHD